jgi:hypothetical protein
MGKKPLRQQGPINSPMFFKESEQLEIIALRRQKKKQKKKHAHGDEANVHQSN